MANETIMQGLLESLMQRPQDTAQQRGTVLANLISQPNPLAATVAYMMPGQLENVAGAARGLFGLKAPVSPQQLISERPQLLQSSQGLLELAKAAQEANDTQTAAQLTLAANVRMEEEAKDTQAKQLRETLAVKADQYKLGTVAESLRQGGDLQAATKAITDYETDRAVEVGGRPAKLMIARNMGVPPTILAEIGKGDYDSMTPADFRASLEGANADLKPFLDASGKARIFKTWNGKVYDDASGKWMEASQLGLAPAPVRTETINTLNTFMGGVAEGEAKNFLTQSEAADKAILALQRNKQSVDLLEAGMKTGAYANLRLGYAKVLKGMGLITGANEAEEIANTETFIATRAQEVANAITAFGSGTGISDADREYVRQMVAGDIALDENSIKNLLAIERRVYAASIDAFNSKVDKAKQAGYIDDTTVNYFKKETPTIPPMRSQVEEAMRSNTANDPTVVRMPNGRPAYFIEGKWLYEDGTEAK